VRSQDLVPDPDVSLMRSTIVDADPATTYQAIRQARLDEDRLWAAVDWLSRLPDLALSLVGGPRPEPGPATVGDLLDADGCLLLADDEPRELVVGAIGRLWDPTEPLRTDLDPDAFAGFTEQGYAKGTLAFTLHPRGETHTLLTLEARARASDAANRQRLERLGGIASPAAGWLARRTLASIAADAENRSPRVPAAPDVDSGGPGLAPLDDVDVADRRVLLRVDVNSPITDGRIQGRQRLEAAAATIGTLAARDAGVAVLAHQGRPGEPDFTDLAEHARILGEILDREVRHVGDVDGEAVDAVESLSPGEVVVLGNVRRAEGERQTADPEAHAQRPWVRRLAGVADLYVNDAFPACHRAHASLVGFPALLPAVAGPGLVDELAALSSVGEREEPRVAVLGGAKPGKTLDLIGHQLARDRVDRVLVGGLVAAAFLAADGVDVRQGTRAQLGEDPAATIRTAGSILSAHREAVHLPDDVAVRREGQRLELPASEIEGAAIRDVGTDTANSFAHHVAEAGTLLVHGPLGVYEQPGFERGTRRVFAEASKAQAYTVIGGGHTVHALAELGIDEHAFDHVSLAGGALLTHLAGEELPGVAALRASRRPRTH
jgi:phosphoglycerate kinase